MGESTLGDDDDVWMQAYQLKHVFLSEKGVED